MKQATQLQIRWPEEALEARNGAGIYEAFQHFFQGLLKSVTRPSVRFSLATGLRMPALMSWLHQESPSFSAIAGERTTRLDVICGSAAVVFAILLVSSAVLIGG